jgi:hypothetical protein
MSDLKRWLKTGDPVSGEPGLSPVDAARMRRVIVAAVGSDSAPQIAGAWPGPFVMATVVAASLAIGVGIGLRLDPGPGVAAPKPGDRAVARGERRQMQFVTSGGTRIIWTFSDEFGL